MCLSHSLATYLCDKSKFPYWIFVYNLIHNVCYSYDLFIRVFYTNWFCIYIHFLKKIQHIQSQYGFHAVPQRRSDDRLFAARTQVPRVTISGFSWACLGRWYRVFEFSCIALLWYCQWMKRDKIHIYIVWRYQRGNQIRPKKNICVFTVTCQKNLGSVGINFFFYYQQNRIKRLNK